MQISGQEFFAHSLISGHNLIEFRAYPEGGDREKDMIRVYMIRDHETKEVKIEDNYFFEYIRKEYEKM